MSKSVNILKGGILLSYDPNYGEFHYNKKCEKCGYVDSTNYQKYYSNPGVYTESGSWCPNCT